MSSEQRAALERKVEEQAAIIDTLKGALAADSAALELIEPREWMWGLTPQERAIVGGLVACSPRVITYEGLLALVPGRDHVGDREVQIVKVLVCRIRKHFRQRLGRGVVETLAGVGYFMPKPERDHLLGKG